jgi:hypothetical protein
VSDRLIKEMVELSQGNDKLIRDMMKTLAMVTLNLEISAKTIEALTGQIESLNLRVGELERESEAERAARPHGYGPI